MKNKKGFLLGEETVKIIIAVIGLLILVYLLASLYITNRNKELELAKASLEHLITDINAGRTETEIYNPKEWIIISFSSSQKNINPKLCFDKGWDNCICIMCVAAGTRPNCIGQANSDFPCAETDFSVKDGLGIEITPPLILSINQQDKTITKKE